MFTQKTKEVAQNVLHSLGWHISTYPAVRDMFPEDTPLDWHVDFIVGLAKVVRPALYVELGVRTADLFNRMTPYAGHLIGVDVDAGAGRYIRHGSNVEFVCASTNEYAKTLRVKKGQAIDMLFIDADHSRESVLQDFEDYFPFVSPHGLILVHDTHPADRNHLNPQACGDAYRAIEELQGQCEEFEMMTIPVSPGLTLCRKRRAQLSWME